ncbi:SusD family protein [bacterium A37T11]|nr:SusD family protein [bacterium A37T11]
MQKFKIFKYPLLVLTVTLTIASCKKFIAIDPPNNQLVTTSVFTSNETATAALTTVYAQMVKDNSLMPFTIPLFTGYGSDELKSYSNNSNYIAIYRNGISSQTNSPTDNIWSGAYSYIYQANAVYEGCSQSSTISSDVKKQLMSEALFIRAYWYFYLVNLYGDVPLVTNTDYVQNSKSTRTPVATVYDQIVSDLTLAEANLNPNYVTANSTTTTLDRVRPNQAAASALLARVYLYMKNYPDAEAEATKVISKSSSYSMETLTNVFLTGSKEAIWQLMMPTPYNGNANSQEGYGFVLTTTPKFTSVLNQIATISDQLMGAFESGDLRKTNWIGTYIDQTTVPATNYYYPNKLKVPQSTAPTEYSTPLRLAEQYLIRAEARAYQSNIDGAKADLKTIRDRAGLGISPANDQASVISAIMHERQVELFAEWGHRWLDLKRTSAVDAVMNIVTPLKGGSWTTTQQLYPIPVKEIQNDNNLTQNKGYN